MIDRLVARLMLRSLRKAFRRICWVGPAPNLDPQRPVVLYANHHTFYDGYVLWLLTRKMLDRAPLTWMAEWDRYPLFGAVGALPFPSDDPQRRLQTIRTTRRRMEEDSSTILLYFPEGELHPPEEGILDVSTDDMIRLDRVLPEKQWWPVAIHLTTRGESMPTLQLIGGEPHSCVDGRETDRLRACLSSLRSSAHTCSKVLLEGRRSPDENWDLSILGRWFERYVK